jgi:RecA-family ATPase
MPDGSTNASRRNGRQSKSDAISKVSQADIEKGKMFVSLQDLEGLPAMGWLIDGLLPSGLFACLYGPPGSYKSFLSLDIGLSIANGMPFVGLPTEQSAVAYIAGEGTPVGFRGRLKAWNKYRNGATDAPFRLLFSTFSLADERPDIVHKLQAAERDVGKKFKLIIIDTLARAFGDGDESRARDMNAFIKACKELSEEARATVLIVAHSGKQEDRGIRGSNSLTGALDTILVTTDHLELPDGTPAGVTLRVGKQKDDKLLGPYRFDVREVTLDDGTESLAMSRSSIKAESIVAAKDASKKRDRSSTRPKATSRPNFHHEVVLELIKRAQPPGISGAKIEKHLEPLCMTADVCLSTLQQLGNDDLIEERKGRWFEKR